MFLLVEKEGGAVVWHPRGLDLGEIFWEARYIQAEHSAMF